MRRAQFHDHRAGEFPVPAGFVTDDAGVVDAAAERALEERLLAFERETSVEVAAVTVRSLGGRSVETYATALWNEWRIGKAGADDGVLVLVAPAERQCRIEYGPGLRGRLTDAVCTRIVAHEMLPRFREGRHGDGLVAGADAVVAALRAPRPAPDVPAPARRAPWTSDEVAGLICVLGVVGVALFVAWKIRREDDRGPGGGGGTVSGPAPWLRPGGFGGRPSGRFGGFGGGRPGGGGASGRW